MTTFIGEHTCKIDLKGRILFPSSLKKQMASSAEDKFVVKKGIFESCLILYPIGEWERQSEILRERINPYNKKHSTFLREFYRGAAEISLDGNNRLLIPKRLLEIAQINNEVILAGQDGKVEIWAKELYEKSSMKDTDFANLAEEILGGQINDKT